MVVGLNLANVEGVKRNNVAFQKEDVESLLNTSAKVGSPIDSYVSEKPPVTTPEKEPDVPVADVKAKTTASEKVANVWKWFSTLGTMTKAGIKGIIDGGVAALVVLGGSWIFNTLPRALSKNSGLKLSQAFLHPFKNTAKSGKVMAGIAAAVVFATEVIAGKLNANQKTAVIDHKLNVGHRDK